MRNLIAQNIKPDTWMIIFSVYIESAISIVETVLTTVNIGL